MRVQRRHIIYVQGYDPRGLAQYYRMFRTELRKSDRVYGQSSRIGRPRQDDGDASMATWTIDVAGDGWATHVTYDFLRWEDLIQRDFGWPIWRTVLQASAIFWRAVVIGVIPRIWRAHWRFGAFITYPQFILLNLMIWSAAAALGVSAAATALGAPAAAGWALGLVTFLGVLWGLLKTTEKRTYALYLMADTIFTWQFAHRQRPEWDARIARFARHLAETARGSDADEIVIVGHSSGSFLGIEILAQALDIDPDLGRHGPRIVLLTLGGNLPIVGFMPVSDRFRGHLARLATEPTIDWIDGQSRKDVMNFYPFDPVTGHGIASAARRNPVIVPVRFRDMVDPAHYNRFRWQFFRVHFQFVMASEKPHPFDFFAIVCAPQGLRDRAEQARAAAAGSAPAGPVADGAAP